jgi:hypothetical protein
MSVQMCSLEATEKMLCRRLRCDGENTIRCLPPQRAVADQFQMQLQRQFALESRQGAMGRQLLSRFSIGLWFCSWSSQMGLVLLFRSFSGPPYDLVKRLRPYDHGEPLDKQIRIASRRFHTISFDLQHCGALRAG